MEEYGGDVASLSLARSQNMSAAIYLGWKKVMRFALCTPSPLGFQEYSHLQGGTLTPSVSVRTPLVCGLGL